MQPSDYFCGRMGEGEVLGEGGAGDCSECYGWVVGVGTLDQVSSTAASETTFLVLKFYLTDLRHM